MGDAGDATFAGKKAGPASFDAYSKGRNGSEASDYHASHCRAMLC